jgi:hypothetical protein
MKLPASLAKLQQTKLCLTCLISYSENTAITLLKQNTRVILYVSVYNIKVLKV